MKVEAGQELLHYKLVEKLGEGGMGVVWKALDTDLDREVAIKFLPDPFTDDPGRLARFEREAKLLASLNHPNVATVYGVHESGGRRFLAMEMIPGEDLSELVARGRLPVDRTIGVARQIAKALQAAHGQGVVHRDLKPANIKVAADGTVKVLDFGLAKAKETAADEAPSRAPTRTAVGSLLGTFPYMSPEQARGDETDERSDIWSFGCVIWECLTGEILFGRKTDTDSLGAILHEEPDWTRLPAETPESLRRILRRTLVKNPVDRLHHVADARIELDDPGATADPAANGKRRGGARALAYTLGSALLAILLVWIGARLGQTSSGPSSSNESPLAGATFSKLTDFEGEEFEAAVSPDGSFFAYFSDQNGFFEVLVGQIETGEIRTLPDVGPLYDPRAPIQSLGFTGDGTRIWFGGGRTRRLKTVPLLGGPVRNYLGETVIDVDWSPDGRRIVFHTGDPGDPVYVADPDGTNETKIMHSSPGMHQHFTAWSVDGDWIYLSHGRLTTFEMDLWRIRPDGSGLERMTEGKLDVRYPTPLDAHTVLYCARDADGTGPSLWALDVDSRVSRRATVGLEQFASLSASADRRRLVATVQNPEATLWRVPIVDGSASEEDVRLLSGIPSGRAFAPRLHGQSVYYLSSRGRGNGLWRRNGDEVSEVWKGGERPILSPPAVSPDGERIALVLGGDAGGRLHVLSTDGSQLRELALDISVRGAAAWSPDGRWIAIGGMLDGKPGLFRIPLDGGDPARIVEGEAWNPVWSPLGDLIVYAGAQVEAILPLLAIRPHGEPVELPELGVFRFGERMRFLPDGSGLVFIEGYQPNQDFRLLDLERMETRQLTRFNSTAAMRTFDVAPDGRSIVFDRLRENSDVVLIELGSES